MPKIFKAAIKPTLTAKIILAFTLLLFLSGLTPGALDAQEQEKNTAEDARITIFHLNDIHAQIDNLPKIAKIINNERAINHNVFFLIAGDCFSGNPVVDQFKPKGEPIIKILSRIKPDALAIGNHEFDYGQNVLKNFIETAPFPILCANIETGPGAIIPKPKSHTILTTPEGVKITVLSFIQVDPITHIPDTHPDNIKGLTFPDCFTLLDTFRPLKAQTDIFIALTHLGYDVDEKLAARMPELDLIVGGHSHTLVKKPVKVNGVYIHQSGSNARSLGRIDITWRNGRIAAQTSIMLPMEMEEDPEIRKMTDEYNNNPELEKAVITLSRKIPDRHRLGNLITDAICSVHNLQVALHNDGGIRVPALNPAIRVMDVFRMLPFTNDIIKFQLTAAELKSLLLFACETKDYSDLKISGLRYTVLIAKPNTRGKAKVKDVHLFDLNGKPVPKNRKLLVGMNSYIASTYKFSHKDPGRALQTNVAETLIQYLQNKGPEVEKNLEELRTKVKEERP